MAVSAGTPIELVNGVYGRLAERVALGRKRLGRTLLRHYVHDVMQTITELPQKPVLVGHSMGGGNTLYLMAFDPRLKVGEIGRAHV